MNARELRLLFLVAGAIVFVDTMFYAAVAPLLPTLTRELHLSKASAGVSPSVVERVSFHINGWCSGDNSRDLRATRVLRRPAPEYRPVHNSIAQVVAVTVAREAV